MQGIGPTSPGPDKCQPKAEHWAGLQTKHLPLVTPLKRKAILNLGIRPPKRAQLLS